MTSAERMSRRVALRRIGDGALVAAASRVAGRGFLPYSDRTTHAGARRGWQGHRRAATLVVSAAADATGEPGGTFRADEFGTVGVFDVDWLLEPRFGRLLDTMVASPGAFRAVRFFGAFTSGRRENVLPADGGDVWATADGPMDFSTTLRALEALTSRGLIPWLVLGFFPSAVSPDPITPPASLEGWSRLVRGFLERLVSDPRFGHDRIRDWWFEVWNEPNDPRFWSGDFARYLDLYRATSDVVRDLGLDVRLGGPAIAYDRPGEPRAGGVAALETFLRFLRDEPGVRCHFVSLHRKGTVGRDEPDPGRLIAAVETAADLALSIDPARFAGLPIVNDEADMKLGFEVPYRPRLDQTFPCWLTAVMVAYGSLNRRYREAGFRFLAAADNANLQLVEAPFDGRRSIVTRTVASPRDLIKLPVFNFYELLPLLGERHGAVLAGAETCFPHTDLYHAVTVAESHLGAVFAVYPSPVAGGGGAWTVDYEVRDLPWPRVNVAWYRIDGTHSNAYAAAGGSAEDPFPVPPHDALPRIRRAQELSLAGPIRRDVALAGGTFRDHVALEPYAVAALWITPVVPDRPAVPTWLEAFPENGNVVLRWTPNQEPFFQTHEVFLMRNGAPAARLSPDSLRAALWVDTSPPAGPRTYGVRSVSASGVASATAVSEPVAAEVVAP